MVLRNVPSTATFEEQRVEINELAADVDAMSSDLVDDGSPQLGGDLDLNGNDITGTGNISYNGNFAMGPNPGTNPKIFLNNNGTATFENTVIADGVNTSNNRFVVRTLNDEKFTVIGDGTVEIGGTPGTSPNIKLYASGSAEFGGGIDLAATNVNGSSINTFGGYTVQGSNGLRVVLDGYNQTTNTVRILTDGSATFAGAISVDGGTTNENSTYGPGYLIQNRSQSVRNLWTGQLNGSNTSTILADGSATFDGNITVGAPDVTNASTGGIQAFASGQLRIQRDGAGTASDKRFQMYYGTTETASITAAGAANFAGAVIHGQLTAGGTGGNYLSNGEVAAYGPSTSANLWRGWNASGGSNVLTSSISAIGSAMFANDITLDRPTAPSDVKISGSDTHAVWLSDGKFALKYDGTASFAETVTIGSGSAAPDDYGLIAYANANTLSNKSAVYARNLADGRNFTGDNAAGATTFELYASGQGNFGAASNSTGNNGVLVGGNNGTLNLYTDRYSTDCFQILNTSGSGTNIALKAYGNGNLEMAGTISDSKGDLRKIPFKQEANAYTLVAADAGKAIEIQGNLTVPNSVFSAGDTITIINDSSSDKTISKGTGLQYMFNTADGTNTNRTLGGRGMATIYFVNSTTCYISGSQLS